MFIIRYLVILFSTLLSVSIANAADDVLLYTYFRGNGEMGTCLAFTKDGLNFTSLNGDKPLLKPAQWPGQSLTRDTSIVFHDGLFHAVWTSNWSGAVFGYAESKDLVHWSVPVKVDISDSGSFPKILGHPKSIGIRFKITI